ncbi:serine/threonine-protein kinase [Bremerella cremea]|uniref:serine/threonine protein kinase n=1 Tax=Bremerella cremea TaxID=1031537 RepID=UPI0031E8E1EA
MTELKNSNGDAASELDLAGRSVGDYRVLRRLGRGAMAEVFLAEQQSLKRNVAVKILLPELAKDDAYVRRFHREAQAAAALTHASIVQIYEVGNADGLHFIAQEYVPGQNLKQLLNKQGTLEVKLVGAILRQVSAALYKAAEQGIVHRDIKPENILITATGEVKVADFGLARVIAPGADGMNLTQVGITMGTPLYMSPEQAEGKVLDQRSDIYSLGVTCYQLLAGRPPFEGDNPLTVAVKHLNTEPERLEKVRGGVPPALSRVIHKMLAKKPDDRYQNASDLLRELREVQKSLGTDAFGSDPSDWSIAELASLSAIRSDGLKDLSDVMKTSAMTVYRRPSWSKRFVAIGGVVLVCLVVGGTLAVASKQPNLLEVPQEQQEQPLAKVGLTASEQFDFAMFKNKNRGPDQRPEYFASVYRHFPMEVSDENRMWGLKAMKQEAVLLLNQQRYREALRVFEQMATQPVIQVEAKAFGYAGKAICLSEMGQTSAAEQAAAEATSEEYLNILRKTDPEFLATFEVIRNRLTGQTQSSSATSHRTSSIASIDDNAADSSGV